MTRISPTRISVLTPWLAPATLSIYLKLIVLLQVGTCLECFDLAGQSWSDKFGEASFLRNDLLLVFFVVPATFLLVQRVLAPPASLAITALTSVLAYLVLFAQLQCLTSVGTFVSPALLRDALAFAWENPRQTGAYFTGADQAVLFAGLAWIAAATWWSARAIRRHLETAASRWTTKTAWQTCAVLLPVLLVVPWIPRVPVTPYHRSALSWALFPSTRGGTLPLDEFAGLTPSELLARYREMTAAPLPSREPRYWGTMADTDVIFFIFETGPAALLDLAGDLSDFPNLRYLRERSFVAPQHYSTAPLTNRALFSIFSSSYYSPFNFDVAFEQPDRVLPGVISRAHEAGYRTALYSRTDPSRLVPGDTQRMRALGFQTMRDLPRTRPSARAVAGEIERERATLALLTKDVGEWAAAGHRFAAAFLPLIGHAPWPDVTKGRARTVQERGRALLVLQDEWLGEVLGELRRHNRLDRTLIVVAADHGLRTRKEDPEFRIGMIDDSTFHVPLLIYAPQALQSPMVIPWVTSHVDIAPTVLDLLGLERDRGTEQGVAIWNPEITRRVTFQLASLYLGSDGMSRNGRFQMYGHLTDRVYDAPHMRFEPEHALPRDSALARDVVLLLERFNALQTEWTLRASKDETTPPFREARYSHTPCDACPKTDYDLTPPGQPSWITWYRRLLDHRPP